MNKDKLVLKNGTEIELESGASLSDIRVLFTSKEDMLVTWDKMTEENLSKVSIQNADSMTVGRYENLLLESETSVPQSDGSIITSFHLREKTEIEKRLDNLESSQEMQNGALDDLGAITSALAEEKGGRLS